MIEKECFRSVEYPVQVMGKSSVILIFMALSVQKVATERTITKKNFVIENFFASRKVPIVPWMNDFKPVVAGGDQFIFAEGYT